MRKKLALIIGTLSLLCLAGPAWATGPHIDISGVYKEIPGDPFFRVESKRIPRSKAILKRFADRVSIELWASMLPAGSYTVWMRAFNQPELCTGGEGVEGSVCSRGDDIPPGRGGPPPIDPCVTSPDDGLSTCSVFWIAPLIVYETGEAHLAVTIDKNHIPGFIILGQDRLATGANFGLDDPLGAEIHVVLRFHGELPLPAPPVLRNSSPNDPALAAEYARLGRSLTRIIGNCNSINFPGEEPPPPVGCQDEALAIFPPPDRNGADDSDADSDVDGDADSDGGHGRRHRR